MDDSLYPNDGSYFQPTEPEEQIKERRVEQSKAQAARPMLEDIIAKISDDIAQMDSVTAIRVTYENNPEQFMKAWYGIQERLTYAQGLKDYVESLLLTTNR